jgi:Zn-dependent protease/uncharacterized Zn finger protein (UPF0148 family)
VTAAVCPQCGAPVPRAALTCPACQWLVHGDAVKRLAAQAERAAGAGEREAALTAWRQALELLPPDGQPYRATLARVAALSRERGAGQSVATCPQCGTELAPALLACPSCHWLVHGTELKQLAAQAEQATVAGDPSAALAAWRQALELLPADARQHAIVVDKIAALSRGLDAAPPAGPTPRATRQRWGKGAAGLGALGVLLSKLKFLLLGLTKAGTLFSMLLSAGVYWTLWGWKFAVGIVVSIYIHEMGHVQALQRYGIKATAPMFIPGLGAVIRLKQYPASPHEDARVGLAGPLWGLGAALAAYAIYLVSRVPIWGAIAHFGAWVNLFNLIPIWQLDGGRGFRALARSERWFAAAVIGALLFATGERLLVLLLIAAAVAAVTGRRPDSRDSPVLLEYVALVALLSVMTLIRVPLGAGG